MFDWVLNTSLLESPIKVKQGNSGSKKSDNSQTLEGLRLVTL